jgi:LysR family transcriptional regulator, transcriptional activator of the cysJI operon
VDNRVVARLENFRLKVFRTVAQHLSFRKAAEHLFLSQPAVTLQIKGLEDDLGVRLFERAPKGVSLTPQGPLLLDYAQKAAALAAEAERKLASEHGKISEEFAIGVSTTIAQYVLPRLIGAFLDEHPRVQLSLNSGNTEEIVRLLLGGKVSVGLIEGPARHREVRADHFMEDEMVLIARADFEFDRLAREQFLSATLLMRELGSGSRRVVESALEKARFKLKSFKRVMNLDSTEAIKSAVEAGLGIGFVSRWAISKELELRTIKVAEVPGLRVCRHFSLISRVGPEPRGTCGAFREFALARARILSKTPKPLPQSRSSSR